MGSPKDPQVAAEELYIAMKGLGTNEKKIIHVLGPLDPETIQTVKRVYQEKYNKDLVKEIKSETSGNFQKALVAFLHSTPVYDAWLLYDAMKGLGTNDHQLIEVLVARHPDHIKKVREAFNQEHGQPLDEWIAGETSGHYKQYLLALASGSRASNVGPLDDKAAFEDAAKLYSAGEGRLGTDDNVFVEVFAHRSYKQLRHIADEYAKNHKHSLQTAIEKEFSGDLKKALLWTLEFVQNKQAFFAKRLRDSMKGLGTHDNDLVRIIVTRRPVDLFEIQEEYQKIYDKSLKEDVISETSGDYRDFLVELLKDS